jgi:hypothetical protein
MRFLLDTNLCICAMKHRPAEVLAQLRAHEAAGLGISSITAAELHSGVAKSRSARNEAALQQFLEPLELADFDAAAAAASVPPPPPSPKRTSGGTYPTPSPPSPPPNPMAAMDEGAMATPMALLTPAPPLV